MTQTGITTPGQSGQGRKGNEGVLQDLQNKSLTITRGDNVILSTPT